MIKSCNIFFGHGRQRTCLLYLAVGEFPMQAFKVCYRYSVSALLGSHVHTHLYARSSRRSLTAWSQTSTRRTPGCLHCKGTPRGPWCWTVPLQQASFKEPPVPQRDKSSILCVSMLAPFVGPLFSFKRSFVLDYAQFVTSQCFVFSQSQSWVQKGQNFPKALRNPTLCHFCLTPLAMQQLASGAELPRATWFTTTKRREPERQEAGDLHSWASG